MRGRRMLHCSFWADNFNGIIVHLNQRDVTMIAISRAPFDKLPFIRSVWAGISNGFLYVYTDFNFDYNVSFTQDEMAKEKALQLH